VEEKDGSSKDQTAAEAPISTIEAILFAHSTGVPMLLEGPPGIGKTFDVTKAAKALKDDSILSVINTDSTTIHDYYGSYEMEAGSDNFHYVAGPLVRAMVEGHWFLADELNLASAEVHYVLRQVIEQLPTAVLTMVQNPVTGKDIVINPGFRFCATVQHRIQARARLGGGDSRKHLCVGC
jgi:midasin